MRLSPGQTALFGYGSLLSIRASASPSTAKTGETVTFHASVRFPPPGAQFTYVWDFDDGTHGIGAETTHRYANSGDLSPRVTVKGTGGSTASNRRSTRHRFRS